MLPLGALRQCYGKNDRTHFTPDEQKTMMTLWCMMRSPLMAGCDMAKMDDLTLALLTKGDVLEIEKASWCAHPLSTTDEEALWVAPRKDGKGYYAAAFNLSDEERTVTIPESALEMPRTRAMELWTGTENTALTARLAPHACAVWLCE